MTIRGVQGHVAYPLQADNPIHALAKFVAAITREPIDAGNEHFPPTTFQMVNVHCDAGAPNVVPGELKCRFNLRYSNVWTHETLSARVEELLRELGIDYEIRWRVAGKPFLTKRGALDGRGASAPCARQTGLDPELSTSGGTSDGRFIAPYGVDVVELGPLERDDPPVNELVVDRRTSTPRADLLPDRELLLREVTMRAQRASRRRSWRRRSARRARRTRCRPRTAC